MLDWSPDDLKKALDEGKAIFLKVWQKGCGPCKMSSSAVTRMEAANPHNLLFVGICTDDYPEIGELAGSDAMPAFFVFKDKKLCGKFAGFKGQARLEQFVQESVAAG